MPLLSSDSLRNTIAALALAISLIALVFSGLSFSNQYIDHTNSIVVATALYLSVESDTVSPIPNLTKNIRGGSVITIFNSGNRPISIGDITIYIQPGDYETLTHVNPTPPCELRNGSLLLYGSGYPPTQAAKLAPESHIVDAQHIYSDSIELNMFYPPDKTGFLEQGILCIDLKAYSCDGKNSEIQFPLGILRAMQGNLPGSGYAFSPPKGVDIAHRLF